MKKLIVLFLLSSVCLTGCSMSNVKQKLETKAKDVISTKISEETGIPVDTIKSITNQVSLNDVKAIGESFTSGNYEEIASYLGNIDFSQIEGLEELSPETLETVTSFIGDIDFSKVSEQLENMDTEAINEQVSEYYKKLQESGVDVSKLSEYIETYAEQYQKDNNLTDEQMSEIKEQIKAKLNN